MHESWVSFKDLVPVVQTAIERLFSWPVAAVILGVLFRRSMSGLITRPSHLKASGGGAEIDITTNDAAEQLTPKALPNEGLAASSNTPQLELIVPEEVTRRRQLVESFGGEYSILEMQMDAVKADLNSLHYVPDAPDTYEVLVRHLAAHQLWAKAEYVYRLIFGSQIEALKQLQDGELQDPVKLEPLFRRAVARSPRFYGGYTFAQWLGFMRNNGLIVNGENNTIAITNAGAEFLRFMAAQQLPKKAH